MENLVTHRHDHGVLRQPLLRIRGVEKPELKGAIIQTIDGET